MIFILFKFANICFYHPQYGLFLSMFPHAMEKNVYSAVVGWNVLHVSVRLYCLLIVFFTSCMYPC